MRSGFTLLIVSVLASAAFGQTTAPADPTAEAEPTTAPATAPAATGELEAAMQALAAGQHGDALKILLDLQEAQGRLPINPKLLTDDQINTQHLLAVTYMGLGDFQKARVPIDRAANAPRGNRTILINRSALDVIHKGNAIRAAVTLADLLRDQPPEEPLVNLFGMALDRASETVHGKRAVAKLIPDYERINASLESTRPGERRWGTSWLTPAQWRAIEERQRETQRLIDSETRQMENVGSRLNAAVADVKAEERKPYNAQQRAQRDARIRDMWAGVRRIEAQVEQHKRQIKTLQSRAEKPTWSAPIVPVVPDLVLLDE